MISFFKKLLKKTKNPDDEVHLRQVFTIAIAMEKRGAEFYASLAENSPRDDVKKICSKLSADEVSHKEIFENMSSKWRHLPESITDSKKLHKELSKYHIFPKVDVVGLKENSVIEYAIEQEDKSIRFYKKLEGFFQEEWKQNYIKRLIIEEKTHKSELELLLPLSSREKN